MPAKRKTKAERMAEKFNALYRRGKAMSGMKDTEVMTAIGLKSPTSLIARKKDPRKFTFGEIMSLAILFQWQESDIATLIDQMR